MLQAIGDHQTDTMIYYRSAIRGLETSMGINDVALA